MRKCFFHHALGTRVLVMLFAMTSFARADQSSLDSTSPLQTVPGGSLLVVNRDIDPENGTNQIFFQNGHVGMPTTDSPMCELTHRGRFVSGTKVGISAIEEDKRNDPTNFLHYRDPIVNGLWLQVRLGIRSAPSDIMWLVCSVRLPKAEVTIGDFVQAVGDYLTLVPPPVLPK